MSARVIEVIEANEHEGDGTEANPHRIVMRYYSRDGELLAERDTWHENVKAVKMATGIYDAGFGVRIENR